MKPFIAILGIAQDGGVPHAGCDKECCRGAWEDLSQRKFAVSLGIIDPLSKERWIIDVGPDFKDQLHLLNNVCPAENLLDGIFITHGHIGHYTGLLMLEKAVLDTDRVPVFVMPKMKTFLSKNRPWKDLIGEHNIVLRDLGDNRSIALNKRIKIKPFLVPHRVDYTETVGFIIEGPDRSVVFIPDIDHWNKETDCVIEEADIALLDGTFFSGEELPGRDMSKVPHPLIQDSVDRFSDLDTTEIFFIHFNHTNPALISGSQEGTMVRNRGFKIARRGQHLKI